MKLPRHFFPSIAIVILGIAAWIGVRNLTCFKPAYHPDEAIHTLMAADFQLPQDLYYWGQDRLGSLVPLLAHGLVRVGMAPVYAVSLVHFAFLLVAIAAFAAMLDRWVLRWLVALVWLAPLIVFNALVDIGQPYVPQLALLGVGLLAAQRLPWSDLSGWRRQGAIGAISLCFMISLWISEFSAAILLVFSGNVLIRTVWRRDRALRSRIAGWWDWVTIGVITGLGIGFVLYAKTTAIRPSRLKQLLSSPEEVVSTVSWLGSDLWQTLTFQVDGNLAIHAWLAISLLGALIGYSWRYRSALKPTISGWTLFFWVNTIVSFVLLCCLARVGYHQSLRYFTVVYVFLWQSILLLIDTHGFPLQARRVLTTWAIVVGLFSVYTNIPYTIDNLFTPPKIVALQPMTQLGQTVGFIGNYGSSYDICATDPFRLSCTQFDREDIVACDRQLPKNRAKTRCPRCVDQVLAAERIYLVRNQWFKEFPNELQQFGGCLTKQGAAQKIAGFTIAPYDYKPF